jgi:hypothetical protein
MGLAFRRFAWVLMAAALLITGGLAVAGHSYIYETEMREREAQGESRSTTARVADCLSWLSLPALAGRAPRPGP